MFRFLKLLFAVSDVVITLLEEFLCFFGHSWLRCELQGHDAFGRRFVVNISNSLLLLLCGLVFDAFVMLFVSNVIFFFIYFIWCSASCFSTTVITRGFRFGATEIIARWNSLGLYEPARSVPLPISWSWSITLASCTISLLSLIWSSNHHAALNLW